MFLTRSEYDRGVNTFSPEGRLFQVEYAIEAVKLGSTAIGICTSEGVILAAEKRTVSPLVIGKTHEKISQVDTHIGVAFAGIIADSRTLVERAQIEAQNYWFTYNKKCGVDDVTRSVANVALQFGDDDVKASMSRPFGVSMLFGGVDEEGPKLFHVDPSGTFTQCDAKSVGSACEGATHNIKEQYHEAITLLEAKKMALNILKLVMEEKISCDTVEMVQITPEKNEKGDQTGKFHRLTDVEMTPLIESVA
ncbi:Proteasome subunit alpha type-5 [Strongyloides ratti]|uniref:Proteasome subunit alpha type n=1 Tax=Strongyloides ratti TaxID=34506 RepID=A0A090LGV7_STRRB|nr:Proteasome subunit alpha type-5 [Strongyloides ratti]CEF69036.1 Proteasome subunit alpha type-5 [Strongyloides ratti]